MHTATKPLTTALILLLASPIATASGLRCDNQLVRPGDSILDVQDACGKPDRKVRLMGEDNTQVGTAYYYRMQYKADRKVYFRGGTVTAIERLD